MAVKPTGKTSLNITLPSDNASASFSWEGFDEPNFGTGETITYLDRTTDVSVTSARWQGKEADANANLAGDVKYSCNGVDYNSRIYNARISYTLNWTAEGDGKWQEPTLIQHMRAIASAAGLAFNFLADNFFVPCDEPLTISGAGTAYESRSETHKGTVAELIDRLIGWSREVPSMQYCVRISGGYFNVVQRGSENGTVDVDANGTIKRNPTFSAQKHFTEWADASGYIYSTSNPSKQPFTGTIEYPSGNPTHSMRYENGYLMEETVNTLGEHEDEGEAEPIGNTSVTTYSYSNPSFSSTENERYLITKRVSDSGNGTMSKTTYTYYETENEKYLGEENEDVQELNEETGTYETVREIQTVHVPLGNGWYGTTVYIIEDGEQTINSTSMSQGAPGGKVSQYMVDVQQEGLTDDNKTSTRRAAISGAARIRGTFPVADHSSLSKIASAMNWLNGKTEITADVEVLGINTAIDIDKKVKFKNKNWYVVSNNISINPIETVQHLQLIRWE